MAKIKGKVYKTDKTESELLHELNAGGAVKAKDLMASMGITVIEF